MPEKTKRPPVSDAGADATEPTTAAPGQHDGQISRPVILRAALRIVDRDGVDGLSMRRLSDEVGRDPTVLYRHIPNKAALLDGVAEIGSTTTRGHRRSGLGGPAARRGPRLPSVGPGAPKRGAAVGNSAAGHPAGPTSSRDAAPPGGCSGAADKGRLRRRRCPPHLPGVLRLLVRTGIGPQTLRLYERRGLLTPSRTEGGTRRYSDDDLERLKRITELVDQGVNLAGIAHILDLETKTIGVALTRQNHHHSSPTYQTVWRLAEAEGLVLQNAWVAGVGEHSRW